MSQQQRHSIFDRLQRKHYLLGESRTSLQFEILAKARTEWVFHKRFFVFIISGLVAGILAYLVHDPTLTETQGYVLFILFFSIGLWVTEAIAPFAVGVMIVGLLVLFLGSPYFNTEPESVKKYVQTWSNSVIWLMLGGFFLAQAMSHTKLDIEVFKMAVSRFGKRPPFVLLGIMLATGIASMMMSNTATTAMMIASVTPFLTQLGKDAPFSKSLLVGIPAAASLGGMGTIIGSPPNAIAVGALAAQGIEVSFLDWMLVGVPVSLFLILIFWKVLIKIYPNHIDQLEMSFLEIQEKKPQVLIYRQRLVLCILVVTVLFWLTSKLHQIPVAAIAGIPIIFLTMTNIMDSEEVRKLPWDTLMLVAGGLALGLAIKETGLASHYVSKLQEVDLNLPLICLIFAGMTVVMSNIMSNTATATILMPIASLLTVSNEVVLPLVIGLSASAALFLPISTPPNAIAFSTGFLKQSDFRIGGLVIGAIGPIAIFIWIFFLFEILGTSIR